MTRLDALGRASVTHVRGVRLPTLPDTLDLHSELVAAYVGLQYHAVMHRVSVVTLCGLVRVQLFGLRNQRCHGVSPDVHSLQALATCIFTRCGTYAEQACILRQMRAFMFASL